MRESELCFHNLEWPAPGARVAGPIAWLRGWIVGRDGHDFVDLRVRHAGGVHRGILGLPRTDLAAHFRSAKPWLPAEFIVGVPVADGAVTLVLEAMDAAGRWQAFETIAVHVAPDGLKPPRIEGRLEPSPDGTWTVRDAHHPFHGHLDLPGPTPLAHQGRIPVFGWLLDETGPLREVLATTDTLVFNHLEHSVTDAALAAKVTHAGAGRARLRGSVDYPDTLIEPACLRVYAVASNGTVHLCFAQRVRSAKPAQPELPPAILSPVPLRSLTELPSGRPRRLLFVVRSLLPNDTTLRALDLARHLVSSHRWAARVVAAEDGPLRTAFESCGVESLVLDPLPLLTAATPTARDDALRALEREIWWRHLDAVAVFDPVCGWAITLARRQRIPVLLDCSETEPVAPDPTASTAVGEMLGTAWRSAQVVCFASEAAARAQAGRFGSAPAEVIPAWFTPGLAGADGADSRQVIAPLRTAAWIARHHPALAAAWNFQQGPAGEITMDRLALQDEAFNLPALQRTPDWSVTGAAFCLGPLFGRGPLRPAIDAAAAGIPVVAPRTAMAEEIFHDAGVPLVSAANPLALAHAFLAWSALPASARRQGVFATAFRARHDPAVRLPQWERLLAAMVARAG